MNHKVVCTEGRCDWHGWDWEMLSAPDPFNDGDTISACPACREINSVVVACDEPECWKEATCGMPTKAGYRQTCGKHRPREEEK